MLGCVRTMFCGDIAQNVEDGGERVKGLKTKRHVGILAKRRQVDRVLFSLERGIHMHASSEGLRKALS